MRKFGYLTILLLAVVLIAGCSRTETPTAPPPPPPPIPTVPPTPTTPPTQPGPQFLTVAQLLAHEGDLDKVVMVGRVVAQASDDDDQYLFADGTGEVRLERDEKDLPVGANIRILGDPQSSGCNTFDGREVCTIEVEVLAWERIQ